MTDDTYITPKPPRGALKEPGRRLWDSVLKGFQLRDDEVEILLAASKLADEIDRIEAVLRDSPVMLAGSKGQDRLNPAFAELRQHRLAMGRLIAQLGLTDADAVSEGKARSAAGRRLALQRWQRRGAS